MVGGVSADALPKDLCSILNGSACCDTGLATGGGGVSSATTGAGSTVSSAATGVSSLMIFSSKKPVGGLDLPEITTHTAPNYSIAVPAV